MRAFCFCGRSPFGSSPTCQLPIRNLYAHMLLQGSVTAGRSFCGKSLCARFWPKSPRHRVLLCRTTLMTPRTTTRLRRHWGKRPMRFGHKCPLLNRRPAFGNGEQFQLPEGRCWSFFSLSRFCFSTDRRQHRSIGRVHHLGICRWGSVCRSCFLPDGGRCFSSSLAASLPHF